VQRHHDFTRQVDWEAIDEEIQTNIVGVLGVTTAFMPHLKTRPSTLINVSSGLAFVPRAQVPVYCATKAFVHSFTVSLRHQLRKTSVRVIEVIPPWVQTELGARHASALPVAPGRGPMPLDAFIQETMKDLATDAEELPVAGAKYFYESAVGKGFGAAFEGMNG
jgi:uncharacterized oxidoreductase